MTAAAGKSDVFQAIADPTRRKVLKLLSEKDMPITEISSQFPVSRTAIVKHLQVLTDAKLVSARKTGREKIYTLSPEPLAEVQEWIAYYEQFWFNRLSVLKHLTEEDKK